MMKKIICASLLLSLQAYAGFDDQITAAKKAFFAAFGNTKEASTEESDEFFTITNIGYKSKNGRYKKEFVPGEESITVQLNNEPNKITIRRFGKAVIKAKPGTILLISRPEATIRLLTQKNGAQKDPVVAQYHDTSLVVEKNMKDLTLAIAIIR